MSEISLDTEVKLLHNQQVKYLKKRSEDTDAILT